MAADIKWLLNNPKQAEIIAERGYHPARKNDTWNSGFDKIVEIMRIILCKREEEY